MFLDDIGRVVRRKESREKVVIACITVALSTLSWTRSNCPRESRGDVHRGENKQAMPPQNRPEEFYRSYGTCTHTHTHTRTHIYNHDERNYGTVRRKTRPKKICKKRKEMR